MYLPVKGLAEALTTAEGGTHLARMIMNPWTTTWLTLLCVRGSYVYSDIANVLHS